MKAKPNKRNVVETSQPQRETKKIKMEEETKEEPVEDVKEIEEEQIELENKPISIEMEKHETQEVNFLKKDLPPKLPQSLGEKEGQKRLYVVLEGANLETIKSGKNFELLNCDDHVGILKKKLRDANDARPDITHQVSSIFNSL